MKKFEEMDLNLYRVFMAVAKEGSISKAATVLYVSQPAVSYSIKLLETELNCKLFDRTPTGVKMTTEAKKLLFYVENAYNTLEIGSKMLSDSNELISGVINLGVPTHIGIFLISNFIKKFTEKYPGVKFFIVNKSTKEMVEMLEKGTLDIIVDSYPVDTNRNDIDISELIEIENCLVGNKKYKDLAGSKFVGISDLRKYPILLHNVGTSTRKALDEVLKLNGTEIEPHIEVATTEMMLDLVKKGLGIGYFSKMAVSQEIANNQLYEIPINIELPKTQIGIAYIKNFLTSAPKEFVNMIKKEVEDIKNKQRKEIRLIITQDCNYECVFCHKEGINEEVKKILNVDDIKFLTSVAKNKVGLKGVHITGGEPLLNQDLFEIVHALKQEGVKVSITTNGYLLKEKVRIGELIDKINISIHSLDETAFGKLTNRYNIYGEVISNVKFLRAKYPLLNIGINMTLINNINNDERSILKMIDFANSIKANLKIIELLPKDSKYFYSIEKIKPILEKNEYVLIRNTFRKQVYSNKKNEIILARCTCTVASEFKSPGTICNENNDIYITLEGKIRLCRKNNQSIDILPAIKDRNEAKLKNDIEEACSKLGENCIC